MLNPVSKPTLDNTLVIQGSLIKETVMAQWAAVQPQLVSGAYLYVDLGQITQSDSAGVAFLLAIMREVRGGPSAISFLRLPKQMLEIAKVNGIITFLPISDS
jgi:phospholipid transport system transporter-binding protein